MATLDIIRRADGQVSVDITFMFRGFEFRVPEQEWNRAMAAAERSGIECRDGAEHAGIAPDRAHWDALVDQANALRRQLDSKPRALRVGYTLHPGSILNAYREGDVTFAEAVEAIRALSGPTNRQTGCRCHHEAADSRCPVHPPPPPPEELAYAESIGAPYDLPARQSQSAPAADEVRQVVRAEILRGVGEGLVYRNRCANVADEDILNAIVDRVADRLSGRTKP
jgi:hypothetical protein